MNCGERTDASGKVRRFALVGIDLHQVSPGDIEHVNVGGGELMIVDVTDPANPRIAGRAPGSTSTHTVTCVQQTSCSYAYSAGDDSTGRFSIFDLRDLDHPVEVDSDAKTAGVQGFASPTAGHKWNFDDAGFGTHTGFNGASMWNVSNPRAPRLVTTTGAAGQGNDPKYPGWNDFILHNSQRPNAKAFRNGASPSLANGNVLLVTEEDYEQPDCSKAGSFQTWWVKRLDGTAERDRAAGQGGALRPRHLPAAPRAPSAPRTGSTTTRPGSSRPASTEAAPSSSTCATREPEVLRPRDLGRLGGLGLLLDAGLLQGRHDDRQEDQPRLLGRPRARHRRLPRRPAGHVLGHQRRAARTDRRAAGTSTGAVAGVLGAVVVAVRPVAVVRRDAGSSRWPDHSPPSTRLLPQARLCEHRAAVHRSVVESAVPARLGIAVPVAGRSSWITNIGDGIALAAGPLLVASETRDPFLVALAAVMQYLPSLLFGLFAGVVADRVDRRRLVAVADLCRVVVIAVLAATIAHRRRQHRGRARCDLPARNR